MLNRHITTDVKHYLQHFPAILITGARQVGKSTLALQLGIDAYVTLDDITSYQSAKADPKGFILSLPRPVIIDEVQRVPDIFIAIKEQIDQDRTPGNFVLTGSSNLQGFKTLSDSLAGRIGIIDLYTFNLSEIYQRPFNLIDHLFSDKVFQQPIETPNITEHVLKGGFPEVQGIADEQTRMLWFTSYIRTYIERDLHDVSTIRNLDSFMRLYMAMALRSSQQLNKSSLGKDCQIDAKTLDNYLTLLRNTYQVVLLKPYFNNALKRLVKMPKLYMLDTGILCHLLKIRKAELLISSAYKGAIFETYVLSEFIKANTYAHHPIELSYYRTNNGKEIDFILDNGEQLVAVKIKTAHTVTSADFKHIRYFIEQQPQRVLRGIVFYAGDKMLPFGEHEGVKLWAVPFGSIAG